MSQYPMDAAEPDSSNNCQGEEKLLKSLLQVLHDVVPVLDQIRCNLQESSQQVPDVSKQLNCVTQATETATVEILDVLEKMSVDINSARAGLAELKKNEETCSSYLNTLSEQIPGLANSTLWKEYVSMQGNETMIDQISNTLKQTNEASHTIGLALQVQDFTAQQIAAANHLIEQVEDQLRNALVHFKAVELGGADTDNGIAIAAVTGKPVTFDSRAVYSKSTSLQEEADKITQQFLGL